MLTCLCLVGQLPITQHLSMPRVFMSAYLALLDRVGQYHTARGAHTNRNTLWPKFKKNNRVLTNPAVAINSHSFSVGIE